MTPDSELLTAFARTNSGDAFAELVRRHVNLVYSAALRQVNGDAHLAQDVAQTVFADLARKAGPLAARQNLTGWLYTSAHFAAAKAVRAETRRRNREDQFMREPINQVAAEDDWEKIRPTLDDAMHELKDDDREAILLRYFENRQFAEVGAKLGVNENAARMRVERALEKLRAIFTRRGVATTAALASAISAGAVEVAPANLVSILTTASLTGVGSGTLTFLKIMTTTKFTIGVSTLIVAGAATALVLQHQAQEQLRDENQLLQQQLAQLATDNQSLSNRLASAGGSQKLAAEQLDELLKLRGETGLLKSQLSAAKAAAQVAARSTQPVVADAAGQQRQAQIHKMTNAKYLASAAMLGYQHQDGQFPTNWVQMAGYFDRAEREGLNPGDQMPDTMADFAEMTNLFDLSYQGAMSNLFSATNYHDIIVVSEKQPWQASNGRWEKVYGFADGHSQIQAEPPEGFDAFEQAHAAPPPDQ